MFRVGAALGLTTGALFIARLYGVALSAAQLARSSRPRSSRRFAFPGIPGGVDHRDGAGAGDASGLPIEGIGILLGVDTIPDMFRTTANVTGQLAAAVIVSARRRCCPDGGHATP